MNHSFRRPLRSWLVCAVVLPILAACGSESGDRGDQSNEETQETTDPLDTDMGRVAAALSTDKTALAAPDSLLVSVTLTNHASHAIRLLRWQTGIDGIREPLFVVTRDGAAVEYVGRHYKRPAPRAKDYVIIPAGASVTHSVDLGEAYDLTISGNYAVHFRAEAPTAKDGIVSNQVGMWVEGRETALTAPPVQADATAALGTTGFSGGCTSSEKSALQTALSGASNYANGALSYLNGTPGSKPRYTTWFGTYSASRWNTAKTHYTNMKNAFDTKNFTLDCSCTDDYYAYVYPNQPYKVYVCNAFWSAAQTGTDSKAGTLVHETSHFNVVASTDDRAYGKSACKSLASSSPTQALDNADSHEYFAENSPAQN